MTRASTQFGTSREIASRIEYCSGLRVGRGERSAPGLRPLSRPLIRSSRGRSGALPLVGWDGCEVRLCVRVPVCVPAPPVSFYRCVRLRLFVPCGISPESPFGVLSCAKRRE